MKALLEYIGLLTFAMFVAYFALATTLDTNLVSVVGSDARHKVACGTDSMRPTLQCNDVLILSKFNANVENVELGEIYTFKSPYRENSSVVHRAVWMNDTHVIFKGDNNYLADTPVPKTDISYKVVGVEYK